MANELLAMAYDDVNERKAERLRECASSLIFKKDKQSIKLYRAYFCRVRLCPMCAWRRALKVGAQMHQIMPIASKSGCKFLFLSLTVRNVEGDALAETLDAMQGGFQRLMQRKVVKDVVKGYYRAMEVTRNDKDGSYHPHYHIILAVIPSYFGKAYMTQAAWTDLWQSAMRLNYTPIVHITRIKGTTAKAIAEVAKYAVKPGDYIIPDDWDLTVDTVKLLDSVLDNRRFLAYGGIFVDIAKKLKFKNPDDDDSDLVHLNEGEAEPEGQEVVFVWYSGFRNYYEV